jgi:hypothetical protein
MTIPISTEKKEIHPKGPNFPLVVALAGITLLLIMIAAVIFLAARGKKDIPLNHRQHAQTQNLRPRIGGAPHNIEMYRAEIILPSSCRRSDNLLVA